MPQDRRQEIYKALGDSLARVDSSLLTVLIALDETKQEAHILVGNPLEMTPLPVQILRAEHALYALSLFIENLRDLAGQHDA
jgi:hypothetical protein